MKCAKCGTKIEPFNNKGGTCGADNCMTKTSPTITIKEELKREYFNWHYERRDQNLVPVDIAYWWLDKLDSILEAERARMVKLIKKEDWMKIVLDYKKRSEFTILEECIDCLKEDIISLLANKEPNGQEEL